MTKGGMLSYPNYSCPCSEISLAGAEFASLDGTYSLIQNPENRFNRGKPRRYTSTALAATTCSQCMTDTGASGQTTRLPISTSGHPRHTQSTRPTAQPA